MNDRRMLLEEFSMEFELKRIKSLELPEKFRLVNHARLIGSEAVLASKQGIPALGDSANYTVNRTYNLFAMLLVNGVGGERLKEIILNYAHNFEGSDTYYAQIVMLGIGVLMIEKGFAPESIYNYLMSLLGDEFLLGNQKYSGRMNPDELSTFRFDTEIVYKPFEGNSRKVKYDLLAFLRIRETEGFDRVAHIIRSCFGDSRLAFYFNLMDVESSEVREVVYEEMKNTHLRDDRLRVACAYALFTGEDVYATHYLFNSIIGKYSRYDKDSSEIEKELGVHLAAIHEKVQA